MGREDFKLEITKSGYRMGDGWEDEAGVDQSGRIVPPPFEVEAIAS